QPGTDFRLARYERLDPKAQNPAEHPRRRVGVALALEIREHEREIERGLVEVDQESAANPGLVGEHALDSVDTHRATVEPEALGEAHAQAAAELVVAGRRPAQGLGGGLLASGHAVVAAAEFGHE